MLKRSRHILTPLPILFGLLVKESRSISRPCITDCRNHYNRTNGVWLKTSILVQVFFCLPKGSLDDLARQPKGEPYILCRAAVQDSQRVQSFLKSRHNDINYLNCRLRALFWLHIADGCVWTVQFLIANGCHHRGTDTVVTGNCTNCNCFVKIELYILVLTWSVRLENCTEFCDRAYGQDSWGLRSFSSRGSFV